MRSAILEDQLVPEINQIRVKSGVRQVCIDRKARGENVSFERHFSWYNDTEGTQTHTP
jgi:hypothetical protein